MRSHLPSVSPLSFIFALHALLLLCGSVAEAQPEWVAAAMQVTSAVPIHRDAVSLTLIDHMAISFDKDGTARTEARIAYRVLRPAGTGVGTMSIPVFPECVLARISGWRFSNGKEMETVDDGDVVMTNPAAGAGYYGDSRLAVVSLPGVESGDVVAFEYALEERGPTARYQTNTFQGRQPVVSSTFSVTIPETWSLRSDGRRLDPIVRTTTGNTTVWSAANLPYEPDEPLTPPSHLPGRSLSLVVIGGEEHSFPDWNAVSDWGRRRAEPAALPDASVSAQAAKIMADTSPSWEKFSAAARFVQEEIRYVALELGEGGWTPRPATETLKNRFGDCKDKATVLRALLRSVGIPSAPVLASTDERVSPELPSPFQFNHFIVAIPDSVLGPGHPFAPAVAEGWFFFDPTDPTVPPGQLPAVLEGGRVLLLTEGGGRLIRLPRRGGAENHVGVDADGTVALDGLITSSLRIVLKGEPAHDLRGILRSTVDVTQLWLSYVNEAIPDAVVKSAAVADSTDSLVVTLSISGHGPLSSAGVEGMFRPNLLRLRLPERLTARTRTNPLWLGPAFSERVHFRWSYDGYLVGPDTLIRHSLSCAGNSFASELRSGRKGSEFMHTVTRSVDVIPASDYGSVRNYVAQLEQAAGASIQLRKTTR